MAIRDVDYGPLKALIGIWKGDRGVDVAPLPDGVEKNAYYETLTFTAVGDVTNAEAQVLSIVHYRQMVQRKITNETIHDETGYWMWEQTTGTVMHSLAIPRGLCLLAGGKSNDQNDNTQISFDVGAKINDENWAIVQSPFMKNNARTTEYRQNVTVKSNTLSYSQTTIVEIYGKVFEHTDKNTLLLQSTP